MLRKIGLASVLLALLGCDYQAEIADAYKGLDQQVAVVPPVVDNGGSVPQITPTIPSSSSVVVPPPSSANVSVPTVVSPVASISGCTWIWDGALNMPQAVTGFDNGLGLSGAWYTYDDNPVGGSSSISLTNDNIAQMVATEKSVSGYVQLAYDLSVFPFAGVGLTLASGGSGADLSGYSGFCIAYSVSGDAPALFELVPANESLADYDNPVASLPATNGMVTKKLRWSSFHQEGWGSAVNTSLVVSSMSQIHIKFWSQNQRLSIGKSADFAIYALGYLN